MINKSMISSLLWTKSLERFSTPLKLEHFDEKNFNELDDDF